MNVSGLAPQDFFGAQPHSLRVPGWLLAHSAYPGKLRQRRHAHAPAYFSFVMQGGYAESVRRGARECSAGHLIFHPAGEEHAVEFRRTTTILRLELEESVVARTPIAAARWREPMHLRGGRAPAIARRIRAEWQRGDVLAALAVEGLALELLAEAFRFAETGVERAPLWLERAREIVESCYQEPLSVARIAEQAGAHRVTLARSFRAHYGTSVSERVQQLRIAAAARELAAAHKSLTEIALGLGFCDQAHFTRVFRRATGLTPGAFRRQRRRATNLPIRYNHSIQ